MNISGNTILITGGGSGIGRALAEAFHAKGNQVVVAGRRPGALDETTAAKPGMRSAVLDVEDRDAIPAFAARKLLRQALSTSRRPRRPWQRTCSVRSG
jgi:uncharacterized oxidoreductase